MSEDPLSTMIDHISLSVGDYAVAKAFYTPVMATLGMAVVGEYTPEQTGSVGFLGFGRGGKGALWISDSGRQTPITHVCFRARTRQEVRDFHAAGLAAGGLDNGEPGIREHYHPAYYGAFVLDPEGHNIEAVCFEPE